MVDAPYLRKHPGKMFESAKDGVFKIKNATSSITASTNNTVVSAQSGKVIRVMGLVVHGSSATDGNIVIRSNNSTPLFFYLPFFKNTVTTPFILPVIDSGYEETAVGESLTIDAITAGCYYSIFYVIYTP